MSQSMSDGGHYCAAEVDRGRTLEDVYRKQCNRSICQWSLQKTKQNNNKNTHPVAIHAHCALCRCRKENKPLIWQLLSKFPPSFICSASDHSERKRVVLFLHKLEIVLLTDVISRWMIMMEKSSEIVTIGAQRAMRYSAMGAESY